MPRKPVLVLLAALLAALAVPAAAPAAPVVGLNINGGAGAFNEPELAGLEHRWNRYFVFWSDAEPTPGRLNPEIIAAYKRIGAQDGRRSLFVLTGTPAWANGGAGVHVPPNRVEDFGSFAGRFARALGRSGDAYEIWNEPDGEFWQAPDRDNPARYVAMLRSAHRAVKAARPRAQVLFGPTTGNNYAYLDAAYRAGAKGHFDAMAVHTDTACLVAGPMSYIREPDGSRFARQVHSSSFLGFRTVRRVMVRNGDRRKPIWITEMGWSSPPDIGPASCARGAWTGQKPQGVSEATQARYLREAYHCIRRHPYVRVALWFNSRDLGRDNSELNNYGLLRADGTRRPAFGAFADIARGRDRVRGGCGDFTAPHLRIVSPRRGQVSKLGDRLVLRAQTRSSDVLRVSFRFRGAGVKHFEGTACRRVCMYRWFRPAKLPRGRYVVTAVATDRNGNVRRRAVRFVKR